jgi:hypothetical protein
LATGFGLSTHLRHIVKVPSIWLEAVRAGWAIRRRRRLGLSSPYMQWRSYTAYGNHNDVAGAEDLVHYLQWRRQMRRLARWGSTV